MVIQFSGKICAQIVFASDRIVNRWTIVLHNREVWTNGKEGVKGGKKVTFERISVQRTNRMSSQGSTVFDWSFESVLDVLMSLSFYLVT